MNFQDLIFELQRYWSRRGCVIAQPWDIEKGAGTFNRETFLRSLGPDPWKCAYVEPCRRPTDGRYGENPNRLQHYYQFQVIEKPSPPDAQQAYLESLTHLGIDLSAHDVRFVEDDWNSPTLGASGLGWEVWLDGMEVAQFTYFQKVAGIDLELVCMEITYGLERTAMFIQGKDSVFDLEWAPGVTYGDIHHADEVQYSKFNFELANTDIYRREFDDREAECNKLLDAGLIYPAYDEVIRCSHAFNMLDARGAIGVSQRDVYIGRVRKLARRCAEAYISFKAESRAASPIA